MENKKDTANSNKENTSAKKEAVNLDKAKRKKISLSGPIAFVMAFLVLLVFVPVNLIVSYYDDFYDMTPNKKYTLDPVTVKLVEDNKDKEIEIYFLAELRGLKEDPSSLPLYHTLTRLDEYDNIKLICFEPNDDPTLAQSLDPTGIHGISRADIFVKCGDVIKKVNKRMIFQNYNEENGTSDYSGEEQIANAIKIVTNGSLPTVYFLTGHGEKSIEDSYLEYANHLKANTYDVAEINLDEAGAIPSDAEIICIAGPQSDITDKERELIDGYLADPVNPGSVSMFMAPCDTEGTFDNIESILYDYGLTMDYNLVRETNTVNELNDRKNQQLPEFMRIHYMTPSEDLKVDLTTDVITLCNEGGLTAGISNTRSIGRIDDDKFPQYDQFERASIIENIPEEQADASSTDEMTSNVTYSTESIAMGGDKSTAAQAERLTGQQLAYAYYSHNKQNDSKLVVFGSTDMIDGDMLSDSVSATNMLALFSNTWLYDTEVSAGVNIKKEAIDQMTFKDSKEATTAIAITVIVPVCVAIFGVVVWLRRRHA